MTVFELIKGQMGMVSLIAHSVERRNIDIRPTVLLLGACSKPADLLFCSC